MGVDALIPFATSATAAMLVCAKVMPLLCVQQAFDTAVSFKDI